MRSDIALVVLCAMAGGCIPSIALPSGAQVECIDGACPGDLVCLTDVKRCAPRDGPCVTGDHAREDGRECGDDSVCIAGTCVERRCGDGWIDAENGEVCEPAEGAACRDDCTLPVCGDGIVDVGETCESGERCRGCILQCETGTADCDASVADGCDCTPRALITDIVAFRGALIGDDLWWVRDEGSGGQQLRRIPVAGGVASTEASDSFIRITAHDGALFVARNAPAGGTTTLERRVVGETIQIAQVPLQVTALLVDDDESIWLLDLERGVHRLDGEQAIPVSPLCAPSFVAFACGGEIVCVEHDATNVSLTTRRTLFALRPDGDGVRERAIAGSVGLNAGCIDDHVVWLDETRAWRDAPAAPQLLAVLPDHNASAGLVVTEIVAARGDAFLTLGSADFLMRAYRLDIATGVIEGIGDGRVYAAAEDALVVHHLDGTLAVLDLR